MSLDATRARAPRVATSDAVHWSLRGLCSNDPEMWTGTEVAAARVAAHLCTHCPVLDKCDADRQKAPRLRLFGIVQAGIVHDAAGIALEPIPRTCSTCAPPPPPQTEPCARPGCEGRFVRRAQGPTRMYCSSRCQQAAYRAAHESDRHPCVWCNGEVVGRVDKRFCSERCRSAFGNARRMVGRRITASVAT